MPVSVGKGRLVFMEERVRKSSGAVRCCQQHIASLLIDLWAGGGALGLGACPCCTWQFLSSCLLEPTSLLGEGMLHVHLPRELPPARWSSGSVGGLSLCSLELSES